MEIKIEQDGIKLKQLFKLTFVSSYISYVCFAILLMLYMVIFSDIITESNKENLWILPVIIFTAPLFNVIPISAAACLILSIFKRLKPAYSKLAINPFPYKSYFLLISSSVFLLIFVELSFSAPSLMEWNKNSNDTNWFIISIFTLFPVLASFLNGAVISLSVLFLNKINFIKFNYAIAP